MYCNMITTISEHIHHLTVTILHVWWDLSKSTLLANFIYSIANIMLSQTEKKILYGLTYMQNLKNKLNSETENKSVVAGVREWVSEGKWMKVAKRRFTVLEWGWSINFIIASYIVCRFWSNMEIIMEKPVET